MPRGVVKGFKVKEIKTGIEYKCKTTACGIHSCICDAWIYHYNQ